MRHLPTAPEQAVLGREALDAICARLATACTAYPVILLYLHGSHARDAQTALSDLDFAVLLDTGQGGSLEKQRARVEGLLVETTRREDVDLLVLNEAGPTIRGRVVRTGRLVFARTEAERVGFEAAAIKQALDFEYFARSYNRVLFQHLQEDRNRD